MTTWPLRSYSSVSLGRGWRRSPRSAACRPPSPGVTAPTIATRATAAAATTVAARRAARRHLLARRAAWKALARLRTPRVRVVREGDRIRSVIGADQLVPEAHHLAGQW